MTLIVVVRIHAGEPNFEFISLEDHCCFSVRILYRASIARGANPLPLLAECAEYGFETEIHAVD